MMASYGESLLHYTFEEYVYMDVYYKPVGATTLISLAPRLAVSKLA